MHSRASDSRERIAPGAEPTNGRLKDITRKSIRGRRLLVGVTIRQLLAYLLPAGPTCHPPTAASMTPNPSGGGRGGNLPKGK